MLEADLKEHGEPLFSFHILDLPEGSKDENIEICAKYFKRMAHLGIWPSRDGENKYCDPRVWIREGEKTMTERVKQACHDLGNVDRL